MARIRTVKPEFWRHPVMGRLDPHERMIAVALFNMADDEGYFRAEPELVRGEVDPFEEDLRKISGILRRLSEVDWIEIREHPEQGKIGLILEFKKHQKISHATPSKLKQYWYDASFPENSGEIPENSGKNPEGSTPDQGSGIRDQGSGKGTGNTRARASDFDCFWKSYPNKKSKGQAERTWEKLCRAKTLPHIDILLESIEKQKKHREQCTLANQWIEGWAHPSTWLNASKWEDELPQVQRKLTKAERIRQRSVDALKQDMEDEKNGQSN